MSHEHDHDEFEEEDDVVEFEDPDGNVVSYTFLAVIEVDGEQFALLTPVEPEETEEDMTAIYVFFYEQDEDGGETFAPVEDEEMLKKVQAEAEKMFAEADEDEA